MATLKNASDFSLDRSLGDLALVTSAAQATLNAQPINGYVTVALFAATADATVANTTTETSLIGTGTGTKTLTTGFLSVAKTLRVKLYGTIAATLTPTLRLKVKFGSTIIIDTTAATLATITGTNLWEAEALISCRTTGATGTVRGQGLALYYTGVAGLAGFASPTTSDTTLDTTATQLIDVTATWGTASALNTITCTNCLIEATL